MLQYYLFYSNIFIGFKVTEDDLRNAATHSKILTFGNDYLDSDFRLLCESFIQDEITDTNYVESYLRLRYTLDFNSENINVIDST